MRLSLLQVAEYRVLDFEETSDDDDDDDGESRVFSFLCRPKQSRLRLRLLLLFFEDSLPLLKKNIYMKP